MKEKFLRIPAPLQKQILLRLGGCVAGLSMLLLILIYGGDWCFLIPCVAFALLCLTGSVSLYDRCLQQKYVVVDGTCTEIERTPLRRRIKAVYLRSDSHSIKLVNIRKLRNLNVGDTVRIYVSEDAPVYEIDGSQVICNYIAIERGPKVQRGILAQPID